MDSAIEKEPEAGPEPEVEALLERIAEQERELTKQLRAVNNLTAENQVLKEKLADFQRRFFAATSEKYDPNQLSLFDESESQADQAEPESVEVPAHKRRANGRPKLPDHLPREQVIHDLPEDQKVCPHDGTPLKEIAPETSEQLDIIPAQVRVIEHIRKKYVCPCCEGHVATASKPPAPLGKSWATAGLLAYLIVSKYVDALPLYRLSQVFKRFGIDLDRTTMANWMIRCGQLVQPLINRLTEHIHEHDVVQIDETPVQVLKEPGRKPTTKSYMWVMAAGPPGARTLIYHYAPSRGADVARHLLDGYDGAVITDGYSGYDWIADSAMEHLNCMAHARRRFVTAKKLQPKGKVGRADQALKWISRLYRIEAQIKDADPETRYEVRNNEARPVLEQLHAWLIKSERQVNPRSKIGDAISYMLGRWNRLSRYLDNGAYPIDNNTVENAIRPFAVGRKNWMFANSPRGATGSANLYSLVQTAKAHGLEPYTYLRHVLERLPTAEILEDIDALLPHRVTLD